MFDKFFKKYSESEVPTTESGDQENQGGQTPEEVKEDTKVKKSKAKWILGGLALAALGTAAVVKKFGSSSSSDDDDTIDPDLDDLDEDTEEDA